MHRTKPLPPLTCSLVVNTASVLPSTEISTLNTIDLAGPAAGRHPLLAVPGSVGMNGDQADILLAQLPAPGVHALGAGP